jgi:hypothetical protein
MEEIFHYYNKYCPRDELIKHRAIKTFTGV